MRLTVPTTEHQSDVDIKPRQNSAHLSCYTHQLSKFQLQTITLTGVDIMISTEAMCLGVLLDRPLTYASHARRLQEIYSVSTLLAMQTQARGISSVCLSVFSSHSRVFVQTKEHIRTCGFLASDRTLHLFLER